MRKLCVLLVFLGAISCRAADRVAGHLKDGNSLVRLQILPSSTFNLRDMERVARRFLDGAAKSRTTAVLLIYADRTIASQEAAGCEGNYLQWKLLYDNFPKGPLLAASVISLQGDAVLWLRTLDGSVFRRVLSGRDPTQISVDGVPLEILFVTARIRSQFEGCGAPGTLDPVLYLKTSATLSAAFVSGLRHGWLLGWLLGISG